MHSTRSAAVLTAVLSVVSFGLAACASSRPGARHAADSCDLAAQQVWIRHWQDAWNLTSRRILHLPDAPSPQLVFYDARCVYTTSPVTAGAAAKKRGQSIHGVPGPWWTVAHDGKFTLPNGDTTPVQLMSFTNNDKNGTPFFVMAAPSYWQQSGHGQEPGLTAVFLHEFSHTRQLAGMGAVIGPIDAAWKFPEELNDDIVQTRFASNSEYVAAYLEERDALYRAAEAPTTAEARTYAKQALALMKSRHARWFTGENAVFATLDATWLSMEGAGQWAGYAWLADPAGGHLERDAAVKRMLGSRKYWSQDEGLALFLTVDRLLPEWPSLVFHSPSAGALELLERAAGGN
ncbi:MAG: hypothetical protein JO197_08475 [Acidobacteria bacterium]|nr:hypothetical protein [Acidobacteriota bacterium]MBV9474655.1 hypothetical protein [Acidobacteriota bacterium]